MSNKSIGIVLSIIIVASVFAIYFYINELGSEKTSLVDILPQESVFVLKISNPEALLKDIASKNQIWRSLDSNNLVYRLFDNFSSIDSILSKHPDFYDILLDKPLFIAMGIDSIEGYTTLLVKQVKSKLSSNKLYSFLEEKFENLKVKVISENIFSLTFNNQDSLYVKINNGILTASPQIDLLEFGNENKQQILKYSKEITALEKFIKSPVNKADAQLFINYSEFNKLAGQSFTKKGEGIISLISDFALWTETDIKIKKEEILLSGFTVTDSAHNYLRRFKGQAPLSNRVINIIPFNTILLINQCYSNFSKFLKPGQSTEYSEIISEIGNEVALVNNAYPGDNFNKKTYAIIHLENGSNSQKSFVQLAKASGSGIVEKYATYTLRKINNSDFLKNIFGEIFSDISENWFTFIDDYVVFANSSESLVNFVRLYDTGKTLDLNENFKIFSDNISTKSNLLIYFQPGALVPFANLFADNLFSKELKKYEENINDVQAVALQYSFTSDMFYTSFYLKHNKSKKEENMALWKVELDDIIYGTPTLVWDHKSKNYNTVVFDNMSNMYLINARGQIVWKKRIDGKPQSEIYEVDFYKNGKIQYLFNTKDFIYLIDKNGNFVKGYPIKLNPYATNGLSLFDYKKNKDYRMMIAQADKKVYNYTIKGKKVTGWSKSKTKDIVKERITRIVANKKDYFIITDIAKNITIVNRRGNERIKLKGNFNKARNSSYYANNTNSKGIILTTNDKGKLVYISSSGSLQYTDFGEFSPQHYFLYADFKGNGANEFIYLDGRELKVFDRFKKLLFSYGFSTEVNQKPILFDLGRKRKALGIVSSSEKAIYLFDQNGNTIINKGLVGQTPFTVGSVNNDNELNLITASGNILYNYRIQ